MLLSSIRRKGCGLMESYLIISIIAAGISILSNLRHRSSGRQQQQQVEFYSPAAGLIASQCRSGRCSSGSCSTPMYSAPSPEPEQGMTGRQFAGNYAWETNGPPWRLSQGSTTIGTLYADGTFRNAVGEVVACPATWFPTGFDTTKLIKPTDQKPVDKVVEKPAVGVPPAPVPSTGDTEPKFGVASRELESSINKSTSSYVITDSAGNVRDITRNDAFNSVGNPQLQSLYKGYDLAIIGIDAQARSEMAMAARAGLPAASNVVVREYDPKNPADLWHIAGDWNHALAQKPALATGGAVAYLTNGPHETAKQREVMAWTPDEVLRAARTITTGIRPDKGIPNHDPEKAKVDQPFLGLASWPLTCYQTFLVLVIAIGAILLFTPKPPPIEAN